MDTRSGATDFWTELQTSEHGTTDSVRGKLVPSVEVLWGILFIAARFVDCFCGFSGSEGELQGCHETGLLGLGGGIAVERPAAPRVWVVDGCGDHVAREHGITYAAPA